MRRTISAWPEIGIHPSQYSITWRNVSGPRHSAQEDRRVRLLHRLGPRPARAGSARTHRRTRPRPASRAPSSRAPSRVRPRRRFGSTPWSSISSSFHPTPMPKMNRPPERWSSVATSFARDDRIVLRNQADAGAELQSLGGPPPATPSATNGSSVWLYSWGSSPPPGHGGPSADRDVGVLGEPEES